jgi:PIN domain nuclease of toxin-antitoxin system
MTSRTRAVVLVLLVVLCLVLTEQIARGLGIEQALGRSDFNLEPSLLRQALLTGGWQELPIETSHALAVRQLPPLHRDPFDRLLLAQAQVEGMLLLTADSQLSRYPGPVRCMAC